ncbi:eukaryotic translation initiation factor 3 subunit CLU1/TIF31 [Rhodotorula toruloides]|uniref:Eukaryotic translation initiation factor 3 subunit CLU1/TIF31 n=1 Tax=Rhodotorula toruloides TaxID=5286 RepID=A0A511KQG8_RHOTO|nr:eukaryotic translation initiation factor 3 subunit CLU1/TIF31 [Rhodotorula toruloides]
MASSSTDAAASAPDAEIQQPQAGDAVGAEQADQAASEPAAVEVTLLVPSQHFLSLSTSPAKKTADGLLELPLPIALSDAIHDLRTIITDAPEGFWLGAFSLTPYYAEEVDGGEGKEGEEQAKRFGDWKALSPPDRKPLAAGEVDSTVWSLTKEGVLGDFADLTAVFGAEPKFWEGKKRGLRVTFTPYSSASMHNHILKVRDVLFSNLPPFASTPTNYDPTSFAIGAGSTLYASVCGKNETEQEKAVPQEEQDEKAKGKKAKSVKKTEKAVAEPTSSPAQDESSTHPFSGWTIDNLKADNYLQHLSSASSLAAISPCLKSLGVSPWSPPPHPRRLRGDLVYLTVQTLESEQYTITGATNGFWVSKSTNATFDPSPRAVLPKGVRASAYHSLFELLADISPSFRKNLSSLIAKSSRADLSQSDLVGSLAITHTIPAAPYLVKAPQHVADPFRTQAAYLLTSSTTADQLPAARDWNDEFAQFLDLPRSNVDERLLRERLICRTQADFVAAATRGAMAIARGDVQPLNPNEAPAAHTFIHNNLLYTKAEDATGMHAHLGGDEASRYAAGKDLRGIEILERLDIDGLSVMQTVLIDFRGTRWICQSLIPGLFKTARDGEAEILLAGDEQGEKVPTTYPADDESAKEAAKKAIESDKPFPAETTPNKDDYPPTSAFRIVYGAADPEKPDSKVRASAYFHEIAKKVAKQMRFAEHDVKNEAGKVTRLYTASDMHGIAATDGRSYFIDCSRMQCVDVEFLEKNVKADGLVSVDYPHRVLFLRPELLEAYRESKLQKWLEVKVAETRAKVEEEQKSVEAELKEAASTETASEGEVAPKDGETKSVKAPTTSVINADDFVLNFNPDAFVERKPTESGEALVIYDPEDESTRNVRLASQYLRDVVLDEFLVEAAANAFIVTDGFLITKTLHRKGINMRYLGLLADKIDKSADKIEVGKSTTKEEAIFTLNLLKSTLQHEMVIRAAKHILNRLLRSAEAYDEAAIISHFYNCFLGTSLNSSPVAEPLDLPFGSQVDRSWTDLSPASLRADLLKEIAARFRYQLPETWFDEQMLKNKVARELSIRVGVQLVARKYDFAGAPTESAEPPINGIAVSSDSEPSASTSKKGKKSKKAKAPAEEKPKARGAPTTFTTGDVLNVGPVVKSTHHRSSLVEETFYQGQRAVADGHAEVGEAVCNDALHICEQIFGPVHAEGADKFHALGIMWHNLAQRVLNTVRTHDLAASALADLSPAEREQHEKQIQELLVPDVEQARAEAEAYLQQAVRLVRQSIVISERTNGVDSADAITQFSDLGLLEQAAGNSELALTLTKHAMNLYVAAYGPKHPQLVTLLNNAAAMVQAKFGAEAAIPLQKETRRLSEIVYGAESVAVGQAEYTLGQSYAMTQDLASALEHMKLAKDLLSKHLAEGAKEVTEATQFIQMVEAAVAHEAREQAAREERIKKALPAVGGGRRIGGARLPGASASTSPLNGVLRQQINGASTSAQQQRTHGEKANLSVDDLVNYIQGPSSSKSRKRKTSP